MTALSIAQELQRLARLYLALKEAVYWSGLWDEICVFAAAEDLVPAVPDGWQLVPKEPNEAMVVAGCRHENMGDMRGRYLAMLSAAPSPEEPTR